MNLETDKAYIAGLVDGEGCIKILHRKANRQYLLAVTISNTNYLCLDFVKKLFKGQIQKRVPKNLKWKIGYIYQATGKDAAILLDDIAPYLIIKRAQYEVARRFLKTIYLNHDGRCRRVSIVTKLGYRQRVSVLRDDIVAERLSCKASMHKLNKRGRPCDE